jgi:hypothetical protein
LALTTGLVKLSYIFMRIFGKWVGTHYRHFTIEDAERSVAINMSTGGLGGTGEQANSHAEAQNCQCVNVAHPYST